MDSGCHFISLVSACFLILSSSASIHQFSSLAGIHPQEERYFASELIKCKDGSKSFTRDRLNDDFCDCADGTDEPGTSACPGSRFYCKNIGSTPLLVFSSRVNDLFCDCCDGSDEYDGRVRCPNTCYGDESLTNKDDNYDSTRVDPGKSAEQEIKKRLNLDDFIQKLKDLKIIVIVEAILIICLIAFRLFYRRIRARRRRRRYH